MFFEDEPEYIKKARTVPVRSTWESRQPYERKPVPPGTVTEPARED